MVRGCPWFGLVLIVAYVLAFVLGPVEQGSSSLGRALAGPPSQVERAPDRRGGQAAGLDGAGAPAGAPPVAPPDQIAPSSPLSPCEPVPLLPAPPLGMPAPSTSGAAPAPTAASGAGRLQQVADRAFVRRDGVWTDTAYTAGQATCRVVFGIDADFALLAERPELTPYFALGDRVIVVLDGQAYEVAAD
jgi:hypothetical protein